LNFELDSEVCSDILFATDPTDHRRHALLIYERMERSTSLSLPSAVPLPLYSSNKERFAGKRVEIILTGWANVDLEMPFLKGFI